MRFSSSLYCSLYLNSLSSYYLLLRLFSAANLFLYFLTKSLFSLSERVEKWGYLAYNIFLMSFLLFVQTLIFGSFFTFTFPSLFFYFYFYYASNYLLKSLLLTISFCRILFCFKMAFLLIFHCYYYDSYCYSLKNEGLSLLWVYEVLKYCPSIDSPLWEVVSAVMLSNAWGFTWYWAL